MTIPLLIKLFSKGPINTNPALDQIMVWGRWAMSDPVMVRLLTYMRH